VYTAGGLGEMQTGEVTQLLREGRLGNRDALDRLIPLVHKELRALAERSLRREDRGHTLQATALVNEAYLRMVQSEVDWKDRVHFFALSARLMRHILVDHARARRRAKRGGGAAAVTLQYEPEAPGSMADVLEINDLLDRLRDLDARKADVVELHFFGGMSQQEIAEALGASPRTVFQDLKFGKAWIARELGQS
jgi:RNA polymerase sigma factor (TIGR02999 family)